MQSWLTEPLVRTGVPLTNGHVHPANPELLAYPVDSNTGAAHARHEIIPVGAEFDAAVAAANVRVVNGFTRWDPLAGAMRAQTAQAVLQAGDGAYYVTALQFVTQPSPIGRFATIFDMQHEQPGVRYEAIHPDVRAIVGLGRWVDLRAASR